MDETPRTCGDAGGRTKAGAPCRSMLVGDLGLCIAHDPTRRDLALAARRAGGRAKGAKIRKEKAALPDGVPRAPKTLEDAEKVASWITRAVLVGEVDARTAEASVKACRQFQLTVEKRVLQDRVKELERALKAARR